MSITKQHGMESIQFSLPHSKTKRRIVIGYEPFVREDGVKYGCWKPLENIINRFENLRDLDWDKLFRCDEYIFRHPSGELDVQEQLTKAFKRMLKWTNVDGRENGLLRDDFGEEQTLYSLRHTYASRMRYKGISLDDLSVQMCTSVKIFEQLYSHFKVSDNPNKFAGHERRATKDKQKAEQENNLTIKKHVEKNAKQTEKIHKLLEKINISFNNWRRNNHMEFIILIMSAIIMGFIGLILGSIVGKNTAGFWLGFLLGPIGWIIVFLLPREEEKVYVEKRDYEIKNKSTQEIKNNEERKKKESFYKNERDIDDGKYQLYLTRTYNIEKNNTLEKYVVDDEIFNSLNEALEYTSKIDIEKENRIKTSVYTGSDSNNDIDRIDHSFILEYRKNRINSDDIESWDKLEISFDESEKELIGADNFSEYHHEKISKLPIGNLSHLARKLYINYNLPEKACILSKKAISKDPYSRFAIDLWKIVYITED